MVHSKSGSAAPSLRSSVVERNHAVPSVEDVNPPEITPVRRFLRPTTVAELSGLSVPHIYKLCGRGEIRAVKDGRAVLIPLVEYERWYDSLLAGGSPDSLAL